VRSELAAQIGSPVRFMDEIEAMYEAGVRVFIEAGPGTVLTRLIDAILDGRPHLAVPCEDRPEAGLRGLLRALAALATAGCRCTPAGCSRAATPGTPRPSRPRCAPAGP
jgi:acyl transferase domain-containing protein